MFKVEMGRVRFHLLTILKFPKLRPRVNSIKPLSHYQMIQLIGNLAYCHLLSIVNIYVQYIHIYKGQNGSFRGKGKC